MGAVGTAVAARDEEAKPMIALRRKIENTGPEFARALPAHMTTEHFVRNALTLLHREPKLVECEHDSIVFGLLDAARLGLEISDVRGQAYLIPRWDKTSRSLKANFQTGYRGDIDLAARAGITVSASEIRELDYYDIERGTSPRLVHRPPLGHRGEVIGYYAVATMADGRTQFEVMSVADVAEHRDRFASQRNKQGDIYGPWVDDFDAMARKTLIRKTLNYMPQALEFRKAVAIEAGGYETPPPALPPRPASPALMPANVDAATGEIDPPVTSPQANNPDVVDTRTVDTPAAAARPRPPVSSTVSDDQAQGGRAQGEQTPTQMIVALAAQHGVETRDQVARMCTQIVGREVVSPTDLKPPEILKVRRVLQALADDALFEFAGGEEAPDAAPGADAAPSAPVPAPSPQRTPSSKPPAARRSSPEEWTDLQWREFLKSKGLKVTSFIPEVKRLAEAAGARVVLLSEIAGVGIADDLVGWVESNAAVTS